MVNGKCKNESENMVFNKLLNQVFNQVMVVDIFSPNLFGYLIELYVSF